MRDLGLDQLATRRLLALVGDTPGRPRRFVGVAGGRLVLVQVCDVDDRLAAVVGRPAGPNRAACREAVLAVVRAAGRPRTRKEVMAALRAAGHRFGVSTVAKALADLTAAGGLVNPMDHQGYRLPGWSPPGLFDVLPEDAP